MNRRNFFTVLASAFATFTLWPRKASALPVSVDEIGDEVRQIQTNASHGFEPVTYTGDPNDPKYFAVGQPASRTRNMKCYVNGVDRTKEAYECYAGRNGWANLFLKVPTGTGGQLTTMRVGGAIVKYSVHGDVVCLVDGAWVV